MKKNLLYAAALAAATIGFMPMSHAVSITVQASASTLTGLFTNSEPDHPSNCAGALTVCGKQAYDTTGNLAYTGNSGVAVASGVIGSHDPFHDETHINDGFYGNGSSWIGNSANSWVKIDLGMTALVTDILFGRYRVGTCCNDRLAGSFTIETALTDDIFSNGNNSNDGAEYTTAVTSPAQDYSAGRTVNVDLMAGVTARYLKFTFASGGAAIDEIEVFGSKIPEPGTLALFALGALAMGRRRTSKVKFTS